MKIARVLILPLLALPMLLGTSLAVPEEKEPEPGAGGPGGGAATADSTPPRVPPTAAIRADEFLSRVAYLASDDMEGRESGTPAGGRTEEYVAAELTRMGYTPLGDAQEGLFQAVPMPTPTPIPERSGLAVGDGKGGFADDVHSPPFSFSARGSAEGGVAFVGYGLTDVGEGYDDYASGVARGRIALALRHGPREADRESPWFLRGRGARKLAFTEKARMAAEAGAVALVLVNDTRHKQDALPVSIPGETASIPVLSISRATAAVLLAPGGRNLATLQDAIDGDLEPRSFAIEGLSARVTATLGTSGARNVVAVRRGTDPDLAAEAVLLCAHIDHVGHGWFGSPHGPGEIHNGADDNASGTAALLEVAEAIAAGPATRRSIVIAGWCGEEKGLIGSRHFAEKPLWELKQIVACLNMDMVGRYRGEGPGATGLRVGGAPTGSGFEESVERLAGAHELLLTHTWQAWAQSDHAAFYAKGVPALFFTTGLHADYHRPGDDWWKIAPDAAARIATAVRELTVELADADGRPEFKEKPPRPVLGVQLDDAPDGKGALLLQVFPQLGAGRAGLLGGDVVTRFAGEAVTKARDLSRLIATCTPGQTVEVVYVRGGDEYTAKVVVTGL